ncbi:MAG TPA: VWA domain-containing protein, partial [Spirochaetota bacterium]|nr:VWA domain-containing protein [Spirochaetota bacterium]
LFSCKEKELSYNEAKEKLNNIQDKINWAENFVNRKANLDIEIKQDINSTLPDIDKFPLTVNPTQDGSVIVEIFVSTEKAGKGSDGWINEVATAFNDKNIILTNGKKSKVIIRSISSGTGVQFIASGKYMPDAFSPSNDLWIKMIDAYNIKTTLIDEKLAGNVAGIVIKDKVFDDLKTKYGSVDLKTIVNATIQGDLAMGYTNPFASSTGLNFLVSVLYSFANGEQSKMLSDEVASAFQSFQQGVPFVSFTTIQMRDSVEKGGSLDAFVLEYQTFLNTKELKSGYAFIPFGVRHDNPLYAIGNISNEKLEALKKFASFVKESPNQKLAQNYGFNSKEDYKSDIGNVSGNIVLQSQKLWKEKKDSGKQIAAVFLCDISGSMDGEPIMNLKKALFEGSKFINKENAIGLVVFNSDVTKLVPIKKFNLMQQASFIAGVEDMVAGGSTAMYDGIMVSLKMLIDEKEKNQNIKPMLFVLTDGETNSGLSLAKTKGIIKGLKIPIYTIGYNADIDTLKNLSSMNEAASINAQTDDVIYKIGALLNSQM